MAKAETMFALGVILVLVGLYLKWRGDNRDVRWEDRPQYEVITLPPGTTLEFREWQIVEQGDTTMISGPRH